MLSRCFFLCLSAVLALASAAAQTASPFIGSVWSGNVSPTSASVVVRLNAPTLRVRLAVSLNATLSAPVYSSAATTSATAGNTVTLTVQGLKPDTDYYYGVEVASVVRAEPESRGRFRTFPLGRASFKIALAGDSDFKQPDQRAFDAIRAERPLLFIHLGDFHYIDTDSTNADDYRANYDAVLSHPVQSALYREVPLAYMWGDHDYCGDDSNGTSVGRDAARAVYKERVPHYPIASAGGTMAQAFTIGRVRVIITDTRSAAVASTAKESASKTRLGTAQKAWFKQELIAARDAGFPMVLWVNPDPWIDPPQLGSDTWAGYATERTELANFIRDNRITNLVMASADMHALAYDDGTHSDYATGGGAAFPVLHAAALAQVGSTKGGPYTTGPLPGGAQYGILEVYDNGGPSVACRFQGFKVGEGPRLTEIFSSSLDTANNHALGNISTLAKLSPANDTITSGFVISGTTPRDVLVRAIGPTLAAFGLTDALARPRLSVRQGDTLVGSNEGWVAAERSAADLTAAFDRAGAFRLLDETSRDAALLLTLSPGAYTVQVKSADAGATGSVLLEVYDLP